MGDLGGIPAGHGRLDHPDDLFIPLMSETLGGIGKPRIDTSSECFVLEHTVRPPLDQLRQALLEIRAGPGGGTTQTLLEDLPLGLKGGGQFR